MKTSITNSVSTFSWEKRYIFPLLIMLLLAFLLPSCTDDSSITGPANQILTDETIAELQAAADMVVPYTPGLIAYIMKEGEDEVIIKRGVSNLATNEPVDEKNFFRIASVTKTFTTEDTVEITCHGGNFIANEIIKHLIANGARLAENGEFTKRAYLNGRIDLRKLKVLWI